MSEVLKHQRIQMSQNNINNEEYIVLNVITLSGMVNFLFKNKYMDIIEISESMKNIDTSKIFVYK